MLLKKTNLLTDEEVDLVLLPPDNVDGDTDNEIGNETELNDIPLERLERCLGQSKYILQRD